MQGLLAPSPRAQYSLATVVTIATIVTGALLLLMVLIALWRSRSHRDWPRELGAMSQSWLDGKGD